MRPYESVTIRGVPVQRVERVTALGWDHPLDYVTRTSVLDRLNADPVGDLVVTVPEDRLDPVATVLAVDFTQLP